MLCIRQVVLSLPLVVVGSVFSMGADSPAITVLKEKGLTRSGRVFVIEAEKPILEKLKESRTILKEYTATTERKNEAEQAEQEFAQLEESRVELQEKIDAMNQQINEQGILQGNNRQGGFGQGAFVSPAFQQGNNRPGGFGQGAAISQWISERDQMRANLTQVTSAQKAAKPSFGSDKKSLDEESKRSLEAAKAVLSELRQSVDATLKHYEELKSDTAVKSALLSLEKDKVGTFKLGPSPTFKTAVKTLEKAELTIFSKKASTVSRKKGKSRR